MCSTCYHITMLTIGYRRFLLVMAVMIIASGIAFASINPTAGWHVSGEGLLLSTAGTDGLGYGFELGGYLGGDLNRWSLFYGEIAASCGKSEINASRFSSLKPPADLFLGAGWCFSPGAGWSLALSGGFAAMKISHQPDVWATGLYAQLTPRWQIGEFEQVPYYCFSISFPIKVAFAGDVMHVRIGVALGADVSIYRTRRGNSFTNVSP